MIRRLRPVGEPIENRSSTQNPGRWFDPLRTHFYASGTTALAAAIGAARRRHPTNHPEVILPAYGCPSLVAAVLYNDATPILVDLTANQVSIDIDSLKAHLSSDTVAVVSVDLFGLASVTPAHRNLIKDQRCTLIRDCAQSHFLTTDTTLHDDELIVLSFGRGKPISVLTGGAVLHSPDQTFALPATPAANENFIAGPLTRLKFEAYNLAIKPCFYGLTDYLPIDLGATRYHQLDHMAGMSTAATAFLPTNLARIPDPLTKIRQYYEKILSSPSHQGWLDICQLMDPDRTQKLLRYAALAPSKLARDQIMTDRNARQLGLTTLYHDTLPLIDNMPPVFDTQTDTSFPNATRFADRLITLPYYSDITASDLAKIERVISTKQ